MIDEETLSFLESALDRDLYVIRKSLEETKPPIRVLVTEAGDKVAHHLIYKICSGMVFGPDQEVILHLANSRGSLYHKDWAVEMFECGFSCYKDFVVSANPAVLYRDVDYAVLLTSYEEVPGWGIKTAFTYQIIKARLMAKYVEEYAKPDCKIILSGPSTKGSVSFLGTFREFASRTPETNITSVTNLDVYISKALLAAKLQTTTDSLKNIVIWSCTYPDVSLATVRMIPPGDLGSTKTIEISISEAIGDEYWMNSSFKRNIFRRIMSRDLLKWGKSIAAATAQHLKVLYEGTDKFDEIQSMGLIAPPRQAYSLPPGRGFSFPVRVRNGKAEVIRGIPCDITTLFNRLRVLYSITHSYAYNSVIKIFLYLIDYEHAKKQLMNFENLEPNPEEGWEEKTFFNKYFITPSPAENVNIIRRANESSKKIAWMNTPSSVIGQKTRSSLRIVFEDSLKE